MFCHTGQGAVIKLVDREILLKEREEKLSQEKQKREELERRKQSAAAAQVS